MCNSIIDDGIVVLRSFGWKALFLRTPFFLSESRGWKTKAYSIFFGSFAEQSSDQSLPSPLAHSLVLESSLSFQTMPSELRQTHITFVENKGILLLAQNIKNASPFVLAVSQLILSFHFWNITDELQIATLLRSNSKKNLGPDSMEQTYFSLGRKFERMRCESFEKGKNFSSGGQNWIANECFQLFSQNCSPLKCIFVIVKKKQLK